MKLYGRWLVVMTKQGKSTVISSASTKKGCETLLNENAPRIDKTTWGNGEAVFTIEKNTKEYR